MHMNAVRIFVFFVVFSNLGCTTVVGLVNPLIPPPSAISKHQKTVEVEFVTDNMEVSRQSQINEVLRESKVFSNVNLRLPLVIESPLVNSKVTDYFPELDHNGKSDLKMKIAFETWGFFEPYCIFTLAVIPCTPPFNVLLSVQVQSADNKVLGTYYVKEEALMIVWALGFLLPAAENFEVKEKQVIANLFNHILQKMQHDGLFQ